MVVLVDSGASGNYFGDQRVPKLKHGLLDHVNIIVPRKSLTAGGSQLDNTTEDLLNGLVTDEYGNPRLVDISILIVPGIGSNLYSGKAGYRSISCIEYRFFEDYGTITSLRARANNIYSVVVDQSMDGYGAAD